jgi:hypothetical protein
MTGMRSIGAVVTSESELLGRATNEHRIAVDEAELARRQLGPFYERSVIDRVKFYKLTDSAGDSRLHQSRCPPTRAPWSP